MSDTDPRTASGQARLLARILAGAAERRLEIVISPPTDAYPLWSASSRPGGHTIGRDGVWSARTERAGWDMDYAVEDEDRERVLAELVDLCATVGGRAGGGITSGAIALEALLDSLALAGRQIVLSPPLGEAAGADQGLGELLEMVSGQTSEYLA